MKLKTLILLGFATFFFISAVRIVNAGYWTSVSGDIYGESDLKMSMANPGINYWISMSDNLLGDAGVIIHNDNTAIYGDGSQNNPADYVIKTTLSDKFINNISRDVLLSSVPEDKKTTFNNGVFPCNVNSLSESVVNIYTGNANPVIIGGASCSPLSINKSLIIISRRNTGGGQGMNIQFDGLLNTNNKMISIVTSNQKKILFNSNLSSSGIGFYYAGTIDLLTSGFESKGVFIAHKNPNQGDINPFNDSSPVPGTKVANFIYDPAAFFTVNSLLKVIRTQSREVAP